MSDRPRTPDLRYGEAKQRLQINLTPTGRSLLSQLAAERKCSLSEAVEQLVRESEKSNVS